MQKTLSPVDAVTQVLEKYGVKPTNLMVMMLIDAVRDTTPPPTTMTINILSKILQSLSTHSAMEAWIHRSARRIVEIISKRPEVQQATKLVDNEHIWDELEGTISGMLIRVCSGKDLDDVEPVKSSS